MVPRSSSEAFRAFHRVVREAENKRIVHGRIELDKINRLPIRYKTVFSTEHYSMKPKHIEDFIRELVRTHARGLDTKVEKTDAGIYFHVEF